MKKLLVLFFLVSFLCFGADTSDNKNIDKFIQMKGEIKILKNQVIELKAELKEVIRKDNKDQFYLDSLRYYKSAKDDAKEIYNKSTEDAKKIYTDSITFIMFIVGGVGTVLLALLGFIRFENKKQLEKERKILEKLKEEIVKKIEELDIEYKDKSTRNKNAILNNQEQIEQLQNK